MKVLDVLEEAGVAGAGLSWGAWEEMKLGRTWDTACGVSWALVRPLWQWEERAGSLWGESHLEAPGGFALFVIHELSQAGEAKLRWSLTRRMFLTPWDQLLWKGGAGGRSGQRQELSWCSPMTALAFHVATQCVNFNPVTFRLVSIWSEMSRTIFSSVDHLLKGGLSMAVAMTQKECEHPLNGWQLRNVCSLCSQELGQWVLHWSRVWWYVVVSTTQRPGEQEIKPDD